MTASRIASGRQSRRRSASRSRNRSGNHAALIDPVQIYAVLHERRQKNVPEAKRGTFGFGDVWTWTALGTATRLFVSWRFGPRDAGTAYDFMMDVASRIKTHVQLTTDGHRVYVNAVEDAFAAGPDVDFAMLTKIYGSPQESETRYSPVKILSSKMEVIREVHEDTPNPKYISTSYVERQNLTMSMHMRRFTRLTNAFSKTLENHEAGVALHYV